MSVVRLLGFATLSCGCVLGRYRERATNREMAYIEEKGPQCSSVAHRRNHAIPSSRLREVMAASADPRPHAS